MAFAGNICCLKSGPQSTTKNDSHRNQIATEVVCPYCLYQANGMIAPTIGIPCDAPVPRK
jgi:hypothetical protein